MIRSQSISKLTAFTLASIVLLSSSPLARAETSFPCDLTYAKELARIDRNRAIREVSAVGAGLAVGLGVAISDLDKSRSKVIAPFTFAFQLVFFGGGTWAVTRTVANTAAKIITPAKSIREAYEAQKILDISYPELVDTFERERQGRIQLALEAFDAKVTHESYRVQLTKNLNRSRLENSLPALTEAEAIATMRAEIPRALMMEVFSLEGNPIQSSLEYAKKKRWVSRDLSYDQWRQHLLTNEKSFCDQGKAKSLKKVTFELGQSI